jgi:hypothetical protein
MERLARWRSDAIRNRNCGDPDMSCGRVKDHYWDQISGECSEPEPDELEMLAMDARQAAERYEAALKRKKEEGHEPH